MHGSIQFIHDKRVFVCGDTGPTLSSEADGSELLALALGEQADLLVLPAARLGKDFLSLRTGVAGAVVQKFVNYRVHLAVVGDLAEALARSEPLRDFVREANKGKVFWVVASLDDVARKLA
ncbi:MAG: hypothetical protein GAK28_01939 [Luteibacter sp.]|uniref:DUF4180 domain-containing protein n=1 Tax=Luteibacter sp. TaxID=1886636 RepID=UPI00137DE25E|nr:DUF4180 domain-containing protein [Luteibacter sp.]KAF1007300.1 MAG: hypothetical protein GAK28_01939 [Luteibacter sp.]